MTDGNHLQVELHLLPTAQLGCCVTGEKQPSDGVSVSEWSRQSGLNFSPLFSDLTRRAY